MRVRREAPIVVSVTAAVAVAILVISQLLEPDSPSAPPGPSQDDLTAARGPVTALAETTPMPQGGDSADDPAIWVNPRNPARSTVIGTNKQAGLVVYGLDGRRLHSYNDGEINNVDLRDGFPLAGRRVTLVVASNYDSSNSIRVYRVTPGNRGLAYVAARTLTVGGDIYGICMYRSPVNSRYYAFATMRDGEVEQWRLFATRRGQVDARRVRSFSVNSGSETEGCVADDRLRRFYVSDEDTGIWRYGAEPGSGTARVRVDRTGRGRLAADVEGLALYRAGGSRGYLIASSQGDSTFALYRRAAGNRYLGSFRVVAGRVDGTDITDGIEAVGARLGARFPRGVFVAQDNTNDGGNQNFKLVPWQRVAGHFRPALRIAP
jgi:3-phytase